MLGTKGGENPRCRMHLGRSPALVVAEYEAERIARERVRQEARVRGKYDIADGRDILETLIATYRESLLWRDVCKSMLGELAQVRYRAGSAGEQLRAEVALFERSLDRAAKIGADLVRLGIEARGARIAEVDRAAVVTAITGALDELGKALGFDPSSVDVLATVERHLQAVTA